MHGGALTIVDRSHVNLSHSSISHGTSDLTGGGIHVDIESVLQMLNVSMKNNTSLKNGGAIFARGSSTVHVQNSSFVGNQAMASSGAVVVLTGSEFIGLALVFDQNFARDKGEGGSIFCERARRVQISDSQFSNGIADGGGSILLRSMEVGGIFVNCSFEDNVALSVGGACLVASSAARFENCSIVGNRAGGTGGSLAAVNSTIDIHNCHFSGNNGTDSGGFIATAGKSEIRGYNVSMAESSSLHGGAVWFHDCVIQLENAHFSKCHARESGGVRDQSSAGEKASAN